MQPVLRSVVFTEFWADVEQRINEWQNDCGAVSVPKDRIRTCVVTVDAAKHFIILIEILFKRFTFSVFYCLLPMV